jgi:hypothetical protein
MLDKAIVVLTRGYPSKEGYAMFIKRALSISQQSWVNNYAHLVFHEGNIAPGMQEWLTSSTGLPFQFISLEELFNETANTIQKHIENDFFSRHFHRCPIEYGHGTGYKAMCSFWFTRLGDFIPTKFRHILRIDEDCFLVQGTPDPFPGDEIALAAPLFTGQDCGSVIRGMHETFKELGPMRRPWASPYTNVTWFNMEWVRSKKVQDVISHVAKTQCIERNRWGDLPLWGATMHVLKVPRSILQLPYFHGSHNKKVEPTGMLLLASDYPLFAIIIGPCAAVITLGVGIFGAWKARGWSVVFASLILATFMSVTIMLIICSFAYAEYDDSTIATMAWSMSVIACAVPIAMGSMVIRHTASHASRTTQQNTFKPPQH